MEIKGYIELPILFAKTDGLEEWERSWEEYEKESAKIKELTGKEFFGKKPLEDPPSEKGSMWVNRNNIVGFNKDDDGLTILSLPDGRKQQFQIKLEEFVELLNKE